MKKSKEPTPEEFRQSVEDCVKEKLEDLREKKLNANRRVQRVSREKDD